MTHSPEASGSLGFLFLTEPAGKARPTPAGQGDPCAHGHSDPSPAKRNLLFSRAARWPGRRYPARRVGGRSAAAERLLLMCGRGSRAASTAEDGVAHLILAGIRGGLAGNCTENQDHATGRPHNGCRFCTHCRDPGSSRVTARRSAVRACGKLIRAVLPSANPARLRQCPR